MTLIAEECVRFSQYYQTYRVYVLQLINRMTENSQPAKPLKGSGNVGINDSIKRMQHQLKFSLIDDMVNQYIVIEKMHIRNCYLKALISDNHSYVKNI